MMKIFRNITVLFILLSTSLSAYALTRNEEAGKKIYAKRCWWCHGNEGAGNGPAAKFLTPKPRDFTSGVFKFHTSPGGEVILDDDLFKTISNGLPGSAMPKWKDTLTDKEREQLVAYIKTFSERFKEETLSGKIDFGKEISYSKSSVEKGRQVYRKAKCYECHGEEGRGDSLKRLKDDWGYAIWPRNLRKPWTYRAGAIARDIYIRVTTGIDGTPMPSFADKNSKSFLTPEERWHVANYVISLQEPSKMPKGEEIIEAKKFEGDLPTDVNDQRWEQAPLTVFSLVGQVIAKERSFVPTIDSIIARAMYNEKEISLLLEWDDRSKGVEIAESESASEQMAVMLAVILTKDDKRMDIGTKPETPVFIWEWVNGLNAVREVKVTGFKNVTLDNWRSVKEAAVYNKGQWRLLLKRPLTDEDKKSGLWQAILFISNYTG